MAGYNEAFARFYDSLTEDVDYKGKADFILDIVTRFKDKCELVLDLACGTGSMAVELASRGIEVIAVDGSPEMLARGMEKSMGITPRVLFLCQDMEELDLYGTVDVTICMLDSLNHVEDIHSIKEIFRRVALFTEPGGLFLFDVNTPYKHREVLADTTFVYDDKDVYCVWQNDYDPADESVGIHLDFFVREKSDYYRRWQEDFREYCYGIDQLKEIADEAGFELIELVGDYCYQKPKADEQRVVFITRRR